MRGNWRKQIRTAQSHLGTNLFWKKLRSKRHSCSRLFLLNAPSLVEAPNRAIFILSLVRPLGHRRLRDTPAPSKRGDAHSRLNSSRENLYVDKMYRLWRSRYVGRLRG